jgi:hypothetical protein
MLELQQRQRMLTAWLRDPQQVEVPAGIEARRA